MGGYGSGRPRTSRAPEEMSAVSLDAPVIVRWIRDAVLKDGYDEIPRGFGVQTDPFELRWTRQADCTLKVTLLGTITDDTGWVYFRHLADQLGEQQYRAELIATPCGFGGRRWWWLCPQTGQRVRTLYLPAGATRFLSRGPGGHHLVYQSQRETELLRAHRRANKLRGKLRRNDEPSVFLHHPAKPPWMRWRTYRRLSEALSATENNIEELFEKGGELLIARLDRRSHRATTSARKAGSTVP